MRPAGDPKTKNVPVEKLLRSTCINAPKTRGVAGSFVDAQTPTGPAAVLRPPPPPLAAILAPAGASYVETLRRPLPSCRILDRDRQRPRITTMKATEVQVLAALDPGESYVEPKFLLVETARRDDGEPVTTIDVISSE